MTVEDRISGFSDHIFWDVDKSAISYDNLRFLVQRVLEYGKLEDWKLLLDIYGLDKIVDSARRLRTLEPKALSFISSISGTPLNQFRCYTSRQSTPEHCAF